MGGLVALAAAFLAFAVPLAVPLLVRRWPPFLVVLAGAALFFTWLTYDLAAAGPGAAHWLGAFLGGLMLVGFGCGAIARLVMLLGRPRSSSPESSRD